MAKRDTYSDSFTGEADRGIRLILGLDDDEEGSRVRRVMLKIINNELTPRQKEIIMLYYFKDMDTVAIGKKLGGHSSGGLRSHVPCKAEAVQILAVLYLRCFYGNSCL